jgi:hypothetical protein
MERNKAARYKVEDAHGRNRLFTNRRLADRFARDESKRTGELQFLAVLKFDALISHPQGRWAVAERYIDGAITLYRRIT